MTINHTVFFRLKHEEGSAAETVFLDKIVGLRDIPGVRNLRLVRETSPKNNFKFGLMMEFESQDDYEAYNIHPNHVSFVDDIWIPEVAEFQEIDFVKI